MVHKTIIILRGYTNADANFNCLLKLSAEDSEYLRQWLNRDTYKWISHDITNEIIDLMALTVLHKILVGIHFCPYYAIMADETTDESMTEQFSMRLRVVGENLVIHEYFAGYHETCQDYLRHVAAL